MTYAEVLALKQKIKPYNDLENDSHGEAVDLICQLSGYPDYISDELWMALVNSLEAELEMYEDHCEIKITQETIIRDVEELVWT